MTQREYQGGHESTSGQQQDQKGTLQQQIQGAAEKVGETAHRAVSGAKSALNHAEEQGAALSHEARDAAAERYRTVRDAATEQYRSARDYALEEAQMLGERALRAGHVGADYARRAGAGTGEFISQNALPLTLIGAGMGWLAWSLRSQRRRASELELGLYDEEEDYGASLDGDQPIRERHGLSRQGASSDKLEGLVNGARDVATHTRQRAAELTDRATHTASQLADRASEGASALAERASHGAERVRTRVSEAASQLGQQAGHLSHEARARVRVAGVRTRDFAEENPLVVGALAIAAGVGVGLLLPNTQPENRLLGETRDRLLGDARGLMGDARGILEDARDTARQTADQIGRGARETAQDIRNQVTDSRISH